MDKVEKFSLVIFCGFTFRIILAISLFCKIESIWILSTFLSLFFDRFFVSFSVYLSQWPFSHRLKDSQMNYFQKSKACQEKNRSHINNHGPPKWSRLGFWVGTAGTVRLRVDDSVWSTVQNRILKVKMWTFYFTCVVFSNLIVHSSSLVKINSFHNFESKTAFSSSKFELGIWYFNSKIKWKYQIFRSKWYTSPDPSLAYYFFLLFLQNILQLIVYLFW